MLGKWITCPPSVETPLFVRKFTVKAPRAAKILVTGLGYFSLSVNGKRVSDDLFTPAHTDYAPRDLSGFAYPIRDKLSCRVLYLEYDLLPCLCDGENRLELLVGNGWYRQRERVPETRGIVYGDSPIAIYDLSLEDEDGVRHIFSDGSEDCYISPILSSQLFLGEVVDTRLYGRDLPKSETILSDFVPERMELQTCPPDRVISIRRPAFLWERDGARIYDVGENLTGYASLTVRGRAGTEITVRYAEDLGPDGNLDFLSTGEDYLCASGERQIQRDRFFLDGTEQTIEPTFVFHGGRYFSVAGDAEVIDAAFKVIHTDLPVTSSFSCDNGALNWLYNAYLRTQLDNFHGCVPSDCPIRERLGYTGDGQICAPTALMLLDSAPAYRKWIDDILSCQGENGHIQHTAPFGGGGGGPGGWGCAVVLVPYYYYLQTGDASILSHTWDGMVRWLGYMDSHSEGGLLVREEEGGWCLGDWASRGKMKLPPDFVNTCYRIVSTETVMKIAKILGKPIPPEWSEQVRESRAALCGKYYADGSYLGGLQGADAYAIYADLPHADESRERLTELCRKTRLGEGDLDVGFLGMDILCEILCAMGETDLCMDLLGDPAPESFFGLMRERGATTIYEYSKATREHGSHNHPMFGAATRQLFRGLLGVRQREGSAGYTDLVISPVVTGKIRRAEGKIRTPRGDVEVSFAAVGAGKTEIAVTIPPTIRAVLSVGGVERTITPGERNLFTV